MTLLTSQRTPLLNNQPDPTKALRQEKPLELPVPPASKDPGARTTTDADLTVLVPVELAVPSYDVTVQAELLAADKKVLATAFAPVRRLAVHVPLLVKLTGPERITTLVDPKKGGSAKIQGKIERQPGVKADVALALTGLPAGAKADAVNLKGDTVDFTVTVTLPPAQAPGELKGLKLSGSFAPDGKLPNVRVRSRDVEITLVVQATSKGQ